MVVGPITLGPEATARDAVELMHRERVGSVVVTDQDKPVDAVWHGQGGFLRDHAANGLAQKMNAIADIQLP